MAKITVVVMTYNQKDYIKIALDSILSQKVNDDFIVLVHDDCSDDGTTDILKEYQKRFPKKIEVVLQTSRQFMVLGYNQMIYKYIVPKLKTKYVALCDGDDYWIDDNKLQKQLDFMETHDDYTMCFHSAYQLKPDGDMSSKWYIKDERDLDMSDFVSDRPGICAATASIFVRTEVYNDFPNWRMSFPVEDLPLCIDAAHLGKIHRFKEVMCVYRQFATGSWSTQNEKKLSRKIEQHKSFIDAIKLFDKETDYYYRDCVEKYIDGCEFRIALYQKDYKTIFLRKYRYIFRKLPFREKLSLRLKRY